MPLRFDEPFDIGTVALRYTVGVAFDTSAKQFDFLKDVKGHVVEASDGGQLEKELTEVYDKKILVEAEEPDGK